MVMRGLEEIDPIAYVRYASSYRRFKDAGILDAAQHIHAQNLAQENFPFEDIADDDD